MNWPSAFLNLGVGGHRDERTNSWGTGTVFGGGKLLFSSAPWKGDGEKKVEKVGLKVGLMSLVFL